MQILDQKQNPRIPRDTFDDGTAGFRNGPATLPRLKLDPIRVRNREVQHGIDRRVPDRRQTGKRIFIRARLAGLQIWRQD